MEQEYDSKYIIIKTDSLESANEILRAATVSFGFAETNYEYLIGKKKDGQILGVDIKNNNVPVESNGYYLYEFDKHIVEALDTWITIKVSQMSDVWWVTKEDVSNIIPQNEGMV